MKRVASKGLEGARDRNLSFDPSQKINKFTKIFWTLKNISHYGHHLGTTHLQQTASISNFKCQVKQTFQENLLPHSKFIN